MKIQDMKIMADAENFNHRNSICNGEEEHIFMKTKENRRT